MPFAPFAYTGLALVLLFCGTMLYGYWFGRKQLRVTETNYYSQQVPSAFDGYKIVHISDLHLSSFADSPDFLQRIIDTMETELAVESLIHSKKLPDSYVVITESSVCVTVDKQELDTNTVAKICDIVMRETGKPADKIVVQSKY